MDQKKKLTFEQVLETAKSLEGKTLKELGFSNGKNKGLAGNITETLFGLSNDNLSKADFLEVGLNLELKTTPIRHVSNGSQLSAKERLVLGMINFNRDADVESFKDSHIYEKIKNTLIVNYLDDVAKPKEFKKSWLLEFTEEEMKIIENDYKIIINKIKNGNAHTLSDSDTTYLSASRKGHNEAPVSYAFGEEPAKKRAWSLKTGFMTRKTREIYGQAVSEIVDSRKIILKNIVSKLNEYVGQTPAEILSSLGRKEDKSKSKHANAIRWAIRNLGIADETLEEITTISKTMKLNAKGNIQESMSFSQIRFEELKETDFFDTDVYTIMSNGFILNIFDDNYKYLGSQLVSFPDKDKKQAYRTYKEVVKSYNGNSVYLPSQKEDVVLHIRNKDKDSKNKTLFLNGKYFSRLCWWINKRNIKYKK